METVWEWSRGELKNMSIYIFQLFRMKSSRTATKKEQSYPRVLRCGSTTGAP